MNNKIGVVYTCITGGYDDLINHGFVNPNWDYVCFTDSKELLNNKNLLWQIKPLEFKELDDVRNQRWYKLHPHLLFSQYKKSLWVDANINIIDGSVFGDIEIIESKNGKISIPIHPERNCIYDELKTCLDFGKDNSNLMKDQVSIMEKDRFPRKYGLFETGIIYREHNNKNIIKIMEDWWWWVKNYSRRDQLSLTYVLWKNNFKIDPLSEVSYRKKPGIQFVYNDNHITKEELIFQRNNFKNIISERQKEVENKNQIIQSKEQEIEQKVQEIQSKNNEINSIKVQLTSSINELDTTKSQLDLKVNELSAIYACRGWKIVIFFRKVIEKVIPQNTYRRKIAGFVFKIIKKILKKRLDVIMYINSMKMLMKKSWYVLKKEGILIFVKKVLGFFFYKKFKLQKVFKQKYLKKEVVFISGCPGDAMRYRCHHQCEQLKKHNINSDIFEFNKINIIDILNVYDIFIFHRVPITEEIRTFIQTCKSNNKITIFDTDDLIFDEQHGKYIRALDNSTKEEVALYFDGIRRYSETMKLCEYGIVSTNKIKQEMNFFLKNVFVNKNGVSDEMINISKKAIDKTLKNKDYINIGYMSGTHTHNVDFKEAEISLLQILKKYKDCRLSIAGFLTLDDKFKRLKSQILRIPYMLWKNLPFEIAKLDINIAPLEMGNIFCEAKSDLKYFEAALVRVPTVASKLGAFNDNIEDGVNGFLAENPNEWKQKLELLISDTKIRERMGMAAYIKVTKERNSYEMGKNLVKILEQIKQLHNNKFVVNWVLQAPIKGTGGYTTIFRMASLLAQKKITCNIYISKIAHLSNMTDSEAISYVRNNFSVESLNIFVGHDNFIDSDVTFATGWSTAYIVDKIKNTKKKCYFVQDFEPEFYDLNSFEYKAALDTYGLGFSIVSIGPYLADRIKRQFNLNMTYYFDFASDKTVYFVNSDKMKNKTRIIFYARSSTKRRGFSLGIEALQKVYDKYKDAVEIVLYGDNDLQGKNIKFPFLDLGVISNQELARQFSKSDIGISFSFSNLSLVPLDMMSCKCAVIEIDGESTRYDLKNEENCLLCDANVDDISNKISILINDTVKRQKLIDVAYNFVSNRSWEKSVNQIIEAIKNTESDFSLDCFSGKKGIEIGGPSGTFQNLLPIYQIAGKIDGVNYSEKTLWDSRLSGKNSYIYYEGKKGDQYTLEATELTKIKNKSYDFLLASHCLEHSANPIKAMMEWIRVLKPGGIIVVIVPNKEVCFDHKRDYTKFEHIMSDYNNNVTEHDLTHLDEILEKHDLSRDLPAGTLEQFRERSLHNFSNRGLHQHVFSPELLKEIFFFFNIKIKKSFVEGLNIVCIGSINKD
jgi:glycosyltransferase involved in cell wall biosynthesis/ubiquinone/menaquinone biosynthesis C-methylase UbiE